MITIAALTAKIIREVAKEFDLGPGKGYSDLIGSNVTRRYVGVYLDFRPRDVKEEIALETEIETRLRRHGLELKVNYSTRSVMVRVAVDNKSIAEIY